MSAQWKPGDVVFATVCGVTDVIALKAVVSSGWFVCEPSGLEWHPDDVVTDVRRAYVLDLTPEQAERIDATLYVGGSVMSDVIDQIRAQIPKREPRPEPDGIGTVVTLDDGLVAVRADTGDDRCWYVGHVGWKRWPEIEPRVVDIKTHAEPVTP